MCSPSIDLSYFCPQKCATTYVHHIHYVLLLFLKVLLGILNVTTKSRLSFLILITASKMPNLSLMPLKPSCRPQHDIRDAVLKYAIDLLNK